MSLITMGSLLLRDKQSEVLDSLNVKGIYSLDFNKLQLVYAEIAGENSNSCRDKDWVVCKFQEALKADYLQEHYKTQLTMSKLIEQCPRLVSVLGSTGDLIFRIEAQFDCFREMQAKGDPYVIREIVDSILGMNSMIEIPRDKKQFYFTLLTRVGFLKTRFRSPYAIQYSPGRMTQKMLRKDPSITRLILGCGRNINYQPYCGFAQHQNALFIDRHSHIAPDVVTDMHRMHFWKKIPTARFEAVLDHTNGIFIFDQARTIEEIYRVLKVGGSFALSQPFYESSLDRLFSKKELGGILNPYIDRLEAVIQLITDYVYFDSQTVARREMLQKAGFVVESDEQMVFLKN